MVAREGGKDNLRADYPNCPSSYSSWNNQNGQSPCTVAEEILKLCNASMPYISSDHKRYRNPRPSVCTCNTPVYTLVSLCATCQGGYPENWKNWTASCAPAIPATDYIPTSALPQGLAVPPWASNALNSNGTVNLSKINSNGASPSPSSDTTLKVVVPAVSAAAGLLVLGLAFYLYRRHRKRRKYTAVSPYQDQPPPSSKRRLRKEQGQRHDRQQSSTDASLSTSARRGLKRNWTDAHLKAPRRVAGLLPDKRAVHSVSRLSSWSIDDDVEGMPLAEYGEQNGGSAFLGHHAKQPSSSSQFTIEPYQPPLHANDPLGSNASQSQMGVGVYNTTFSSQSQSQSQSQARSWTSILPFGTSRGHVKGVAGAGKAKKDVVAVVNLPPRRGFRLDDTDLASSKFPSRSTTLDIGPVLSSGVGSAGGVRPVPGPSDGSGATGTGTGTGGSSGHLADRSNEDGVWDGVGAPMLTQEPESMDHHASANATSVPNPSTNANEYANIKLVPNRAAPGQWQTQGLAAVRAMQSQGHAVPSSSSRSGQFSGRTAGDGPGTGDPARKDSLPSVILISRDGRDFPSPTTTTATESESRSGSFDFPPPPKFSDPNRLTPRIPSLPSSLVTSTFSLDHLLNTPPSHHSQAPSPLHHQLVHPSSPPNSQSQSQSPDPSRTREENPPSRTLSAYTDPYSYMDPYSYHTNPATPASTHLSQSSQPSPGPMQVYQQQQQQQQRPQPRPNAHAQEHSYNGPPPGIQHPTVSHAVAPTSKPPSAFAYAYQNVGATGAGPSRSRANSKASSAGSSSYADSAAAAPAWSPRPSSDTDHVLPFSDNYNAQHQHQNQTTVPGAGLYTVGNTHLGSQLQIQLRQDSNSSSEYGLRPGATTDMMTNTKANPTNSNASLSIPQPSAQDQESIYSFDYPGAFHRPVSSSRSIPLSRLDIPGTNARPAGARQPSFGRGEGGSEGEPGLHAYPSPESSYS